MDVVVVDGVGWGWGWWWELGCRNVHIIIITCLTVMQPENCKKAPTLVVLTSVPEGNTSREE